MKIKAFTIAAMAVLALCIGVAFSKPAAADVTFGTPYSYTPVADINANGSAYTVYNVSSAGYCKVTVYGFAAFSANLDIYTSIDGKFDDAVKQALVSAAGATFVNISAFAPKEPSAIRIQDRAYTSGDPLVSIDCKQGAISGPVVVPTPAATP